MSKVNIVENKFWLVILMVFLVGSVFSLSLPGDQAKAAYNLQTTNQPPEISFTPIQTQFSPSVYVFDIVVTDDGLPNPPGEVDGSVEFIGYGAHITTNIPDPMSGNVTSQSDGSNFHILTVSNHYTVTLSTPGSMFLRVTANDGELSSVEEWTFTVDDQNSGDTDGDGMPDAWEVTYGFDPNEAADAAQDADDDKLTNVEEYQNNTIPTNFDTDGDLLPDGFELNGNLDPLTATDIYADPDVDALVNFDELIYSTHPNNGDTDNDGAGDGTETNQCSDPNDASDLGQAPPQDEVARISLTVGDHSLSHSERYNLIVGPITHQAPEFGKLATSEYCFRAGQTYPIRIVHNGSCPNQCWDDLPDYDYTALISAVNSPAGITIDDPEGILGEHNESDPFYAQGKTASLTINVPEPQPTPEPTPEYDEVEIKIRAFIPCGAVDYSDPFDLFQDEMFGGDGRSFSYNSGTSRVEQTAIVTLKPSVIDPRLDLQKTWVVTTTQYSEDDGEEIPGQKEDWCKSLKPTAAEPEKIPQHIPDMADASRTNDGVKVYLDIDVGNPFVLDGWAYPNTDAEIDVFIRQDSGQPPQYKIEGEHDGFPAYEIYLDGKLVYCHDPLFGDSPASLLPPMDETIDTGDWKEIEEITCEPIKGIQINSPIGEPGSLFTVTGNGFGASNSNLLQPLNTSNETVNVFINDKFLGSVTPDIEGRFQFTLNTSNASLGKYIIRVDELATGESYQTQFILEENTFIVPELNNVETTFDVPSDIALSLNKLFLPIILN